MAEGGAFPPGDEFGEEAGGDAAGLDDEDAAADFGEGGDERGTAVDLPEPVGALRRSGRIRGGGRPGCPGRCRGREVQGVFWRWGAGEREGDLGKGGVVRVVLEKKAQPLFWASWAMAWG